LKPLSSPLYTIHLCHALSRVWRKALRYI